MNHDPISSTCELGLKRRFGISTLIALVVLGIVSVLLFQLQTTYEYVDFYVHMHIAGDFDFADLHTITSRLAYPMWHLLVSIVYQLGVPLEAAAIGITTLCKLITYVLTYWLLDMSTRQQMKRWALSLTALIVVIVTGVWIRSVSFYLYNGVGSPNVWHNPTQIAVSAAMLMVMPWLLHCWYEFERMLSEGRKKIMLPWWKVIVLAVLGMGSLACKPTFMQALLPAAFVMYLVELIRHKEHWRYFGQIVLAFVPSAAYFLLQYLYYTGVVVMYTSGVEIGITLDTAWKAVRNTLMMAASPLAAVIACWRKGMMKDRALVLALLMVGFSVLEAMAFRETGMREGHGNFTWAANLSAFYLWVVMAGTFLRCFADDWKNGMPLLRKAGYAITVGLLGWHVYSGVSYIYLLLTVPGLAF